jgi:HSP20 family protein
MLMRFDPFRDLDRMSDQLSRPSRAILAMDAVRSENEVMIYIDVPGVARDDIDVSVEKNELTVSVDRRWSESEGQQVISNERPQGTFTRRIVLSDALDLDRLRAKTSDGVLIIAIPIAERSKPRRIDVSSEPHDEAIETTSSD